MINQKDLEKILIDNKTLAEDKLIELADKAKKSNKTLEDQVICDKIIAPAMLYELAAKFYNLPFINLKNQTIAKEVLAIIPEITAQAHQTVAFDKTDKELLIATLDVSNIELFDYLNKKSGLAVKVHIASPESIAEALRQYQKSLNADFEEIKSESEQVDAEGKNPEDLKNLAHELPTVKIVDTLLEHAIAERASDIHIEPAEKEISIRYRIDGVLKRVMTLPKVAHPGLIARIKILSDLKLDEHRLPQDGRFKIKFNEAQVAFRVSIIPTFDGEKIVMRLLPEQTQQLSLKQLGFQPKQLEVVERNVSKPNGMFLVTGPTGSGKTTTLYTVLQTLNKPEVNISTIEDPIEYRMQGINQSQVQPKIGFSFAAGLRAFLRQDPNIIMVGEIRDKETAEIAINAAMTGHLVLSTLHTNDAATTIPRFIDMDIPTFLIASTLNLIIAQRLVRKICENCIESYNLDEKALAELEKQFNFSEMEDSLTKQGQMAKSQKIGSMLFYRGKGCQQCNNTGYKGRLGIYEVLEVDEKISALVIEKASSEKIQAAAIENGMITLLQDGFIKAKTGITTLEEVLRVTAE